MFFPCSGPWVSVLVAGAVVNPNPWDELGREQGVTVWTRAVPGSDFREMRAEGVLAQPAEKVWAVISDVKHYTEFMPYTVEVRLLSTFLDGFVHYVLTDPPMVSRRDCTTRHNLLIDRAAGLYQRTFEEDNASAPPLPDGVVRMKKMRGFWSVEAIDAGHTRVEYVVHTEPGGMVPSFLVNRAGLSTMGEVFRSVRERLRDPSWKRS